MLIRYCDFIPHGVAGKDEAVKSLIYFDGEYHLFNDHNVKSTRFPGGKYDGGSALSSVESRTFHFSFTAEEVGDNLYSVETTDGMTMSIGVVSNIILVEFVDPAGGAGRAWGKATDTTWSRMEGRMAYDDGSLEGEWILMTGTPPPGW